MDTLIAQLNGMEKLQGEVTQWNGSWGFVEFADGRRAYVHNTECGGVPLNRGQYVMATVVPDPRNPGKWQAKFVERIAAYADDNSGRIAGVVEEWQGTHGFIQFSDGRRAYVHQSGCKCGGVQIASNITVVGMVLEDPKNVGKWMATEVQAVTVGLEDRVEGVVQSWSGTYGFIQFKDGRRAYVHNSNCSSVPLQEGEAVVAKLAEDPKNPGKWCARDVHKVTPSGEQPPDGIEPPSPAPAFVGGGQAGGSQAGGSQAEVARVQGDAPAVEPPADTTTLALVEQLRAAPAVQALVEQPLVVANYIGPPIAPILQLGTVKTWNSLGGYGFVEMEDTRQAYVHNSQCGGSHLQEGEVIMASIVEDPRNPGKWQAVNVQSLTTLASGGGLAGPIGGALLPAQTSIAPVAAAAAAQQTTAIRLAGGRVQGTVQEWSPRGYGFIQFGDGTRAYVHNSQCNGEHLELQEVVEADIVPDTTRPGKYAAHNVVRTSKVNNMAATVSTLLGAIGVPTRAAGQVKEWSQRGYGFVIMQDGRRCYVHNSQCGGEHLEEGELIYADIVADPQNPGKWQAQNVERAGVQGAVAGVQGAAAGVPLAVPGEPPNKKPRV